ncbi:hypothetical protein [Ancylobacter sp.]|uniref:hypothetical protein n=1 Tax=Ancylobacter sp. TaxID=1872567 RepID=UPI003BABD831
MSAGTQDESGAFMWTLAAVFIASLIAYLAGRANERDRPIYDGSDVLNRDAMIKLHIRQDLRLISFLLFGVIVMLGVAADRL